MTDQVKDETTTLQPKKRIVIDSHGHAYELTGKLGEGGQGVVCKTTNQNVLVKICTHNDERLREEWINHIRWLMRQPLENLTIARPVAIIEKPRLGYVMELMDGLAPISHLLETAEYSMLEGGTPADKLSGFLKTGGLKRRVTLLAKLARLLADLHGRGMAFGDLSPSNVFISESLDHSEVWLIDCDNLCVSSRTCQQSVFTPDYGAPEIIRKESGVNTLTDSWSFAVMAFRLLTLSHPLKGDVVNNGGPEMEEMSTRGELPWVDHSDDRQNEVTTGLPRDLVLTDRLKALFSQCFDEGLNDPGARPSMSAWAAGLEAATALAITCEESDCGSTFFAERSLQCPFCDHNNLKENHVVLTHRLYSPESENIDEDLKAGVWIKTDDFIVLSPDSPLELRRSPVGTSFYSRSDVLCTLELTQTGLKFTPHAGVDVLIHRVEDGKAIPINRSQRLKIELRRGDRYVLHLGDLRSCHPTWTFNW